MDLLGNWVCISSPSGGAGVKYFYKSVVPVRSSQHSVEIASTLHPCQQFVFVSHFNFNHSLGLWYYLIMLLILHFPEA